MLQNVLLMDILIILRRERWKWTWHFDTKNYMQYENPWHSEDSAEWSCLHPYHSGSVGATAFSAVKAESTSYEIVGGSSKARRHFAGTCAFVHCWWLKNKLTPPSWETRQEKSLCFSQKNGSVPTDYIYTETNFQTPENSTDASFTPFSLAVFLVTSASAWRQLQIYSNSVWTDGSALWRALFTR